jgi:environmental stress-induced protein Ves
LSSVAAKKGQAVARKALPPAKRTPSAVKKAAAGVRKPALALVKRSPPTVRKSAVRKPSAKKPRHTAKKPSAAVKKPAAKKPPTKAKTASAAASKAKPVARKPASAAKKIVASVRKAPAPAKKPAAAKKSVPATAKSPPKGKKPVAAPKSVVASKKTQAAKPPVAAKPPALAKAPALAKKPAAPEKASEAKKPSGATGKASVPVKKAPPAAAAPKPVAGQARTPAPAAKQAAGPKLAPLARPEPLTVRQVPARATPMITPIMPRAPIASWIKKPTPPVKKAAVAKKPPVKLGPLVRLTPEDYQPVPVKHQRWTTRNVAVAAPGDRPLWRVGLTRILQDCDFSHFDRMDRTIMMIDGLGFELDFGGNGTALLDRRYNPVEFRGEWATRCRLVSGPVEVINVITDRRRATHHVTVMAVGMNERLRDLKGEASVIFCLVGEAELVLGKERFVLAAGETLRSTVRGRMSCRAATTSALIYVIEVKKR